ncbi:MAG: serine/threonine-protein kinase [Myxococcota bacterium]
MNDESDDRHGPDGMSSTVTDSGIPSGLGQEPPRLAASSSSFELGRYVIVGTLGRGAMGVVFKAFDPSLDRFVALKVLQRELRTKDTARLLREAQAMAKLSHPNVVQVYEVGKAEGRAFVAMEMVEGQTLRAWMDRDPRPDWRTCVAMFTKVGQGLVAAHEQGLVHRDFKPGNAIVDDEGRPRVLDFGLARLGDGASLETVPSPAPDHDASPVSLTRTGAVLGTPAYMPPEQMSGAPADARSDQFSFCVALYEAVYGQRPYTGDSMMQLMLAMRDGDVEPAPKGSPVPASLRAVLVRGLSAAPSDRWPDMATLLEQLRRLLAPGRKRGAMLGLTAGLLVVGAGLGAQRYAEREDLCTGARLQLDGVWDDARRTEVQSAIAGTELPYAADTWQRVESRLDEYGEAWVTKHTEVCEATRVSGEQTEAVMGLRMSCLGAHRKALHAAATVLAKADATVVRDAVPLVTGLPALSQCDDVAALEQRQQRVPPPQDPDKAERVEALRERVVMIEAEFDAGLFAEALEHVEPVVQEAVSLGYGPLLAEVKRLRGQLYNANGQYEDAERDLLDAYALAVEQDYDSLQFWTANALVTVVGDRLARHAEGRQWSVTARPLAQRIGDAGGIAASWGNLGIVLLEQADYEEAKTALERARKTYEEALGPEHLSVANNLHNLGNVLEQQGDYAGALAAYERSRTLTENVLGPRHPDVAKSWNNLGIVLEEQGKYEEAKSAYEQALEIRRNALGEEHPYVAATWNNLAVVAQEQGEHEAAKAAYERVLSIDEKTLGLEHPNTAGTLNNLGTVFDDQGRYDEALAMYERALEIKEKALGLEHPSTINTSNNLANTLEKIGDYERSRALHEQTLRLSEKALGKDHPDVADSWNNLGVVLNSQQKYEEAAAAYKKSLSIKEKILGGEHLSVADIWENLGSALGSLGKYDEAKAAHERALGAYEKAEGPEHMDVADSLVWLATATLGQGDLATTRTHAERALAILEASGEEPERCADARFLLARVLWSDRPQRARARALAQEAATAFAEAGESSEEQLAETKQWLRKHPAR